MINSKICIKNGKTANFGQEINSVRENYSITNTSSVLTSVDNPLYQLQENKIDPITEKERESANNKQKTSNTNQEDKLHNKTELKVDKLLKLQNSKLIYIPVHANQKKPIGEGWQTTTKTPAPWKFNNTNKALLTGERSNVIILDIDNKRGGLEEWIDFCREHPEMNDVVQVETPSGGRHLYFQFTNSFSRFLHIGKNKDWDLRTTGHCALVPDSIIDGKSYKWIHNPKDKLIKPMPDYLVNYLVLSTPTEIKEPNLKVKFNINLPVTNNEDIYFIEDHELTHLLNRLPQRYCDSLMDWRTISAALKNAGKHDLWDTWSKQSSNYDKAKNEVIWSELNTMVNINYIIDVVNRNSSKNDQIKPKIATRKYDELELTKVKCGIRTLKKSDLHADKHILLDEYIKDHPNIRTFIVKSGTNTGKTTTVAKTSAILLKQECSRVISITSRRSLVGQQSKTFNNYSIKLVSYRNSTADPLHDNIVCQLDSLDKLFDIDQDYSNSIIYLDECDSLIKYLVKSKTLKKHRINVFTIFNKMIKTAKYVIGTDADVSDVTMKYLEEFRDISTSLLLINPIKNYKGKKAKRFCDQEEILKQMDWHMKQPDMYYLAAFDEKGTLDKFYKTLEENNPDKKHLMVKYTSEDGDENDFENFSELNKGKYVFYSPKVIYGLDFVPDVETDVFIVSAGTTIDPKQIGQQATRCRNIKMLYYFMHNVSKAIKFNSLDECKQYVNRNRELYEEQLKDLNILYLSDPCKKPEICKGVFSELFYIIEYQSNILESNFIFQFNTILLDKGFTLDVIGDTNHKIDFSEELKKLTVKDREQMIIGVLNGSIENKQMLNRIEDVLKILHLTRNDIIYNPVYWQIITNNKKFRGLLNFNRLVQDNDTTEQVFVTGALYEFPENYISSIESKVKFCHKIENILNIRVLEHDSNLIASRQHEKVQFNGETLLKNYHNLFEDSERARPIITFMDYYKLLISCYNHLIAYDLFRINTTRKQINNERSYVFDNVEMKIDIIKPYLEIYGKIYKHYHNLHDDIVNTFKIGSDSIIKLDKQTNQYTYSNMQSELVEYEYDSSYVSGVFEIRLLSDQIVNTKSLLPSSFTKSLLLDKFDIVSDNNEIMINSYINNIYQFQDRSKELNSLVERLSDDMIDINVPAEFDDKSVKSFIDGHYEITNNGSDLIDKNVFTQRYNEYNDSSKTFTEILPYLKEIGIVYDRCKRHNKERGFIIGLKCKPIVDIKKMQPAKSNKFDNKIYMLGDDEPIESKKQTNKPTKSMSNVLFNQPKTKFHDTKHETIKDSNTIIDELNKQIEINSTFKVPRFDTIYIETNSTKPTYIQPLMSTICQNLDNEYDIAYILDNIKYSINGNPLDDEHTILNENDLVINNYINEIKSFKNYSENLNYQVINLKNEMKLDI